MNASPSLDFDVMRATDLGRRPVHAARLLLQDVHPPAAAVAAVREGAAPRRRARPAAQEPARARVAHRVPPPPRRRAGRRRRRRRAGRRDRGGRAGRRRRALPTRAPSPAGGCWPRAATSARASWPSGRATAGVELLSNAPALGAFDGLVPVWQGDTLHQVRAQRHVYATGAIEQPLLFAGNDLPGVMLSGGARRLAALYAVKPGHARRGGHGRRPRARGRAGAARRAAWRWPRSRTCARTARQRRAEAADAPRRARCCAAPPCCEAAGRGHVRARRARPARGGRGRRGERRARLRPARGLRRQRAGHLAARPGGRDAPATTTERGLFALRDAARRACSPPARWPGAGELGEAELLGRGGRRRGRARARARRRGLARASRRGADVERLEGTPARPVAVPPPVTSARSGKCFACLCEDVTAKDIHLSVAEGYDSIELSKRYTTATMGPCQGRMCQLPAVRLMAEETGQSLEQVGTTTARPPWHAVPMGALAGRPFEPAKRSAIHGRHRELGANVMWAGDWRRAYDYGDARGRGAGGARGGRPDRRLDARQADRARARRRRAARPALPEPLLEPRSRAASATA